MHIYDYSFLKEQTPGTLMNISNILFDLRARDQIRRGSNIPVYDAMRQSAIIDSVRASNAIEGIITTRQRVEELTSGAQPPLTHDEQEILGYRNDLSEIYTGYTHLDITERNIHHFHEQMLRMTSPNAGHYKTEDNWIQERDAAGHRSVRFAPVSAAATPEAMEQMMLAYYDARQDSSISNLLLTFCVVLDFLCIHPYEDGNGRMSRLLTILLLQRNGFDVGQYISIEGKINAYKAAYYDALKASSVGWHDNENSYTFFMTYMLQILYQCYKDLDERFTAAGMGHVSKGKRVEYLLMNTYAPLSKEEIHERVPDVSISTVERVLQSMVADGRIVKIGSYRDARYKKA